MMKKSSRGFYLVFSPSQYSFTAIYKDSDDQIYDVFCNYDAPGFNYIQPKTHFKNRWQLIKTGVDFKSLSIVKPIKNEPVPNDNNKIVFEIQNFANNISDIKFNLKQFEAVVNTFNKKVMQYLENAKKKKRNSLKEFKGLQSHWDHYYKDNEKYAEDNRKIIESLSKLGEEYLQNIDIELYQLLKTCMSEYQELVNIFKGK